jgi:hypothetical protein
VSALQEAMRHAGAAAPGTIAGLRPALRARIESLAAGFWGLETKTDGKKSAPQVVGFTLPPRTTQDSDQFPFIAIRPRAGSDSEQGSDQSSRATVDIEIGTYSDSDDGDVDLHLIIDAIRVELAANPVLTGTQYEHIGPLTWEVPFPQPRPQWLALVTTVWALPRPQRVESTPEAP